jgi:hypothetical protein
MGKTHSLRRPDSVDNASDPSPAPQLDVDALPDSDIGPSTPASGNLAAPSFAAAPPAAATPAPTISFAGGTLASGPPDPGIAVGVQSVVTIENFSIKWYSRDGTQQGNEDLFSLFSPVLPNGPEGDPRVAYDSVNDRFVVTETGNGGTLPIAVSKDGNPNDGWYLGTAATGASSLDYPSLSVDGTDIYIQANVFTNGNFTGNVLAVINDGLGTGGIYDGGPAQSTTYTSAQVGSFEGEPAAMLSPVTGTPRIYLYNRAGFSSNGPGNVDITEIDNPTAAPTFIQHSVSFTAAASTAFVAPSQPGTSQTIEVDGTNAVWRNGFLYCVEIYRPASGPDANVATTHWFKINTSTWTLADQGDVSGSTLGSGVATYDPTIAVDGNGDFAINFTASGPNLYAGSYYALHRASDPAGTLETPQALHVGVDTYDVTSLFGAGTVGAITNVRLPSILPM